MASIFHAAIPASQIRGQVLSACVHGIINAVALPEFKGVKTAVEAKEGITSKPYETVLGVFEYSPNYADAFEIAARNEAARAFREMRMAK